MSMAALPAFSSSSVAFEKLKTLEGKWEGTVQWSGARTETGKMNAVYSLTGNGSAVVEDLISEEGKRIMTSVYHMDGDTLRMTHYCGTGNQPRFKAMDDHEEGQRISFEMVDITNMTKPDAPHVNGAEITFKTEKEFTLSFSFISGDKKSAELIQLHRIE